MIDSALAVAQPGLDLTYADLRARAGGLHAALREAGVGPGTVVAAAVTDLADLAVTMVAVNALGAVAYTLPDPAAVARWAERLEAAAVVVADDSASSGNLGCPVVDLDRIAPSTEAITGSPGGPGIAVDAPHLGAVVRVNGLDAIVDELAARLGIGAADRLLTVAEIHADLTALGLLLALRSDATAIAPGRLLDNGDALRRVADRYQATVLIAPPHRAELLGGGRMAALRAAVLVRDPVPARLPDTLRRVAGPQLRLYTATGRPDTGVLDTLRDGASGWPLGSPTVDVIVRDTPIGEAEPPVAADGSERIRRIVADALALPGLDVGTNLFEVGASSLELVRAVAQLEADLDFEADLDELLDAPFVQTLIRQYATVREASTT
jgi:acyl-coenzyme A synthetase/AMP-(fatty) acid ligase/acyl carrier protein